MNVDLIFDKFVAMENKKRYIPPTEDYFPTVQEIERYWGREDIDKEQLTTFLVWLEDNLSKDGAEKSKEARTVFHKYAKNMLY